MIQSDLIGNYVAASNVAGQINDLLELLDEAQSELSKDLVKFKMFATESEAKEFKKENKDWSDVAHTDKGYYCAYSVPCILATQSVKEAGEYYKLNVELTAGYIVHRNWFGCH